MNDKKKSKKSSETGVLAITQPVAKKSKPKTLKEVSLIDGLSNLQLRDYCHFFDDSGLEKLEIKSKDFSLKLAAKKHETLPMAKPVVQTVMPSVGGVENTVSQPEDGGNTTAEVVEAVASGPVVVSPIVGTFYSKPNPEASNFVKVGDNVVKGQVIGIIEAMKIMNEIESTEEGIVQAMLVENGEVVVEGQKLLQLK